MFSGQKDKSFENHWFNWAANGKEQEELYQMIRQLVIDMIAELVPQELEKYFSNTDIMVDVINSGKIKRELIDKIQDAIYKSLR